MKFKKNALIEKRFKDTKYEAKFHWKSSFLQNDHYCDIENIYLYLPGHFWGGSWVVSGYFIGVSWVLQDYFKNVFM